MQRMGGVGPGGQGMLPMQQQRVAMGSHPDQQLQKELFHQLLNEPKPPGWKSEFNLVRRVTNIFQLVSQFKIAQNHQMTLEDAVKTAKLLERKHFQESSTEEHYINLVREQIQQLSRSRQLGQPGVGQPINQNTRLPFQPQMQMQNGIANGMPMQSQLAQGFQGTMPQQSMQLSSLQQQMNMEQPQPGSMGNGLANAQLPQNSRLQQNMLHQSLQQLTPNEERMVAQMAQRLQQSSQPAQLEVVNQKAATLPPAILQRLRQQGITPQQYVFRLHAASRLQMNKLAKAKEAAPGQQQFGRPDNDISNQLNQQARQTPRSANNLDQSISGAGQNGNGFEVGGNVKNMHEITALQQEAMRSQELGHQVVPASNSQSMAPPNQQQRLNTQNTPRQQNMGQQHTQQAATPTPQQQSMLIRHQQNEKIQAARRAQMQGQAPQQPALIGQAGGLTTNLGQGVPRQSPAMPTLNKPLEQSAQQVQGQANPNLRQQPTPDQNASSQRINQQPPAPNVGAPQINPAQLQAIISRLPPHVQQRLNSMTYPQKVEATLELMRRTSQARNGGNVAGRPSGAPPNAFASSGQNMPAGLDQQTRVMLSNPQNAGAQPAFNAPVPQMRGANPSTMQPGQQQQWGIQGSSNPQNMTGMMTPQHIPNDGRNQQGPLPPLSAEQIRGMDSRLYPPSILGNSFPGMPSEVRTWGQLKAWVNQSPHSSKEVVEKLRNLQALHFHRILSQRRSQMASNQQAPVSATMLSQAPVPTAQMIPSGAQTGIQNSNNGLLRSGQAAGLVPQPTMQDVQNARTRLPPQFSQMTDDQLLQFLWASRLKAAQASGQLNMDPRQASMQVMQQHMSNLQRGTSGLLDTQLPPNQQQANRQVPIKAPTGAKPSPNPGATTPAQQMRINQPNVSQITTKAAKRGSADDVVEVPNPNLSQQQNQNQKLGKQGQGNHLPGFQPQGHDRAQYEAELRKHAALGAAPAAARATPGPRAAPMGSVQTGLLAQQPNSQAPQSYQPPSEEETLQRKTRFSHLSHEIYRNLPKQALIPLDADTSRNMAVLLQREFQLLSKTENAIHFYYIKMRGPEATIRELLTIRFRILRQYRDRTGTPNDYFTISPQELQAGIIKFRQFMQFSMRMASQTASQTHVPPHSQPQQTKPVLTEQNLHQNQQAEQQAFQKARQNQIERQHSNRGMKVPAAPTTSQPPFSFGAQSPPHGVPQYGNQGLTADQLHIPTNKRRKPNGPSATGTPVEKKGTPGSNASPKVTKDAIPPSVKPIPPTHKCFVANCPVSKTFPTAEALAQHKRDAHEAKEPVIDDPFAWAMESIRIGLGLDENGDMRPKEQKQAGAVEMKKSSSAQGVTPMKQEVATPSNVNLKTPQPSQGQVRSPQPARGVVSTPAKPGQTAQTAVQLPPTPPSNPWDDTPFSPQLLSSCFPSLADLHSSLAPDIVTLTPSSSVSRSAEASPQTDKNSPEGRKSDIGENNELDMTIRITGDDDVGAKNKFWPEGFFNDCMYPEQAPIIDEVTLGMGWEELFGETPDMGVSAGKKRKENDGFDASLFRVWQ